MAAVILVSVVVVNLVTIAADLQAGAALAELLLASRYGQVVAVLRHLMLGFAAFGVAVLAHPDWPRLLTASLVPGAAGSWSA